MPENNLFEYAIIRIVPRVEREEFLNVGVIIYSRKKGFLQTKYSLDEQRLQAVFGALDLHEIKEHLEAFKQIADGNTGAGPIAVLDPASRFRWLTAKRSTIVQTSAVHPGLSVDIDETMKKLLNELVLL
jgi:hypothetical protein